MNISKTSLGMVIMLLAILLSVGAVVPFVVSLIIFIFGGLLYLF